MVDVARRVQGEKSEEANTVTAEETGDTLRDMLKDALQGVLLIFLRFTNI